MRAEAVREFLQSFPHAIGQPSVVFGQPSVALECQCDNLETVYISPSTAGGVLVSDKGKSFAYLARGTDATYLPLIEMDLLAVGAACEDLGVSLRLDDPEAHPRIECAVLPEDEVAGAVARVAEAVDRVFAMALRNP